jgi:acetyl-CoA carboxylase biotin carboxyl carrier protein
MDIQKINELIQLLNNTDVGEIEICEGDTSIRISRQSAPTTTSVVMATPPPAPAVHAAPASSDHAAHTAAKSEHTGHTVRSPMVGTIYLAPSPGANAFTEVGQTVKAGDVLCIIEAMKMMNQIEADKSGKIAACLVENSQPVEFDQPLFIIE